MYYGPDNRSTSKYYLDSAFYWLRLMLRDISSKDKERLKYHYQNFVESFGIAYRALRKGD